MSIGVVVIGRNVAGNLRRLVDHFRAFPCDEIVYVDSDSNDESVAVARAAGWRAVALLPEGVIGAAAGRYVGTSVCQTDWILYLDGDMLPDLQTVARRGEYLRRCADPMIAGSTGNIVDVYADGSQRVRRQKSHDGERAVWFGGAVILKRQAVLDAGNWNPNVYAEEEWDLDARLRKKGWRVLYFKENLVHHHTAPVPAWQVVARFLGLYDSKNPRNGGAGYVIRSAIQAGSLWNVIAVKPEVFGVPLGTLAALLLAILSQWIVGALLVLFLFAWVYIRRGPQFFPICYLTVPQMIIGLFRYRRRQVRYRIE